MGVELPLWPATPPAYGSVVLREFTDADIAVAVEMGEDPYIPLIGTLPAHPTAEQALAWVRAQRQRLAQGIGLSFAIADATTGRALGAIGLWLQELAVGRANVGYAVSPRQRGRGVATQALRAVIAFAWSVPVLYRIDLYVEPWNAGSIRVAESAGFSRERLLPGHQEIGGVRRDMVLYSLRRPPPRG